MRYEKLNILNEIVRIRKIADNAVLCYCNNIIITKEILY